MRLLSCYISGFGQIKEFSYDFKQDFDAVCQENGWGKTTFSVFLKAMFYGMEYSQKTKILPERRHYMPWDGTVCGGNLVFKTNEKVYRIERTFGKKDKDDTFALYDVTTGFQTDDFSENIGEELFGVDRDSFEKSIFIPQSAIATQMTDSLNAKMGDMAAAKNDINHFDAALNRVSEARKSYTRKSRVNNGRINVIKDELSKCNETIDKKPAISDGYEKQKDKLREKKKTLDWLEAEKNRITDMIRSQSKKEQDMGAYRQKLSFYEKQKAELEKLDDFFSGGVPELSEQEAMEDLERQHDVSSRTENDLLLKLPLEQQIQKWNVLFANGVPTTGEMELWNKKVLDIQELRLQGKHAQLSEEVTRELEELKRFFQKKLPTDEELSEVEKDVVELSRLEGRIVELDELYRNTKAKKDVAKKDEKDKEKFGSVIVFFALFVAFLFGALTVRAFIPFSTNSIIIQVVCYVAAAASVVAGIMQFLRIRTSDINRREDLEQRLFETETALAQCKEERDLTAKKVKDFLSDFKLTPTESMQQMVYEIRVNLKHYLRLQEDEQQAVEHTTGAVEELADIQMELYTGLGHFADVYNKDLYHDGGEAELLEQLKKDAENYEEYTVNKKQIEILRITLQKQEELLDAYCRRFPTEENRTPAELLKTVRNNIERYGRLQEETKNLKKEIEQFAVENNMDEKSVSVEELQRKQEELDEEINQLHKGITQDNESISALCEEMDQIEDAESRRDVLLEEKAECERKVALLTKTEDYLQMAKEQFLSKYIGPLRKGMDYYMTLLDESNRGVSRELDFDITMDLDVQVIRQGTTHASDYLSCGYQDLVALCARFALVDVLYKNEKPMIVLDDPFTNLDEEKTKKALQLLTEIAKDRQIIYFTCHKSRMPVS